MVWLDPARRERVEAPASATGMAWLSGLTLPPEALLSALLGLTPADASPEGLARQAALRLEPGSGRLAQRQGEGAPGAPFQVEYQWPEGKGAVGSGLLMPASLRVTLGEPPLERTGQPLAGVAAVEGGENKDFSRWELTFSKWSFPTAWQGDPFRLPAEAAGFAVIRHPELGE